MNMHVCIPTYEGTEKWRVHFLVIPENNTDILNTNSLFKTRLKTFLLQVSCFSSDKGHPSDHTWQRLWSYLYKTWHIVHLAACYNQTKMEDSIRKKPDWRSICDTSASLNPRAGDQYAPQRKTLHMMNILKPYLTAAIYIFSPRAVGASLQNDGVVCLTQLVRAGALVSVRPASRVVVVRRDRTSSSTQSR